MRKKKHNCELNYDDNNHYFQFDLIQSVPNVMTILLGPGRTVSKHIVTCHLK